MHYRCARAVSARRFAEGNQMPDGTGDDYGAPSLGQLKQLAWDVSYIRNKLTYGDISKTLVWRRSEASHQVILGQISFTHATVLGAFRGLAALIEAGEDGEAPPVENFGQSSWTQAQLMAFFNNLNIIASKIMTARRTCTMRMSALAASSFELTVGNIEVSSVSFRLAVSYAAGQIEDGSG